MNALERLDTELFTFVNGSLANPFFDAVMPVVTNFRNWRIPVLLIVLAALVRGGREVRVAIVLALLAVGATDRLACGVVKPFVDRERPFKVVAGARKLSGAHGDSFPSAHAANTFAAGTFLALRFARLRPILVIPAVVSFSRVYVGVHYPLDVVAGAGLGASVGAAFAALDRAWRKRRLAWLSPSDSK